MMKQKIIDQCFGYREDINMCGILNNKSCKNPNRCVFYKTKEQREHDFEKAKARIKSLPAYTQKCVEDTYYKKN